MAKIPIFIVVFLLATRQEVHSAWKFSYILTFLQSLGSFGEGSPVYGLHQPNSDVYLVRDSTPYLDIYGAFGGQNKQINIAVSGMQGPYDMVGFAQEILYIVDWFDSGNITVASLQFGNGSLRFSLQENSYTSVALAVDSNSGNVIATCSQSQKIKEFTRSGQLLRELYVDVPQPRHSIRLRSGDGYVMCHGYGTSQLHRVCRLDNTGLVVKCYGSTMGSGTGQLDVPARVLEDKNGNILVADQNNKRVVLLSPSLDFIRYVLTSEDGLQGPARMMLNGPLLYLADNTITNGMATAGRVRVFSEKHILGSGAEISGADAHLPLLGGYVLVAWIALCMGMKF